MDKGTAALYIFMLSWVSILFYGRKRRWSWVTSIGGGFIAAILLLGAAGATYEMLTEPQDVAPVAEKPVKPVSYPIEVPRKIQKQPPVIKGLHQYGIAKFLYKVKHGASLADGVDYVFWSDKSKHDRKLDNKFESIQLIDGLIVYSLVEYAENETIEFTILAPMDKGSMYLEGQRLRHACHRFAGNKRMINIYGEERVLPLFEPVEASICKPSIAN